MVHQETRVYTLYPRMKKGVLVPVELTVKRRQYIISQSPTFQFSSPSGYVAARDCNGKVRRPHGKDGFCQHVS